MNAKHLSLFHFARFRPAKGRISAIVTLLFGAMLWSSVWAQNGEGKRAFMRERFIERQQERQQEHQQQLQRQEQRQEQRQMQRQQEMPTDFPPDGLENRPGPGRLTPEQRQALRRQILEAGRQVYPPPKP